MSLTEKIQAILEKKIEDGKKAIVEDSEVEYILDAEGHIVLDESGNPVTISVGKEEDEEGEDEEEDDMKDKKDKKKDMKESLDKIFKEAKVDESVSKDLTTLFEAVVSDQVKEKLTVAEEKQAADLAEFISVLESRVDKYMTYVATEWLKENEVAVEAGIKIEIAENLVSSLKTVFEDSYVEVPENKIDIVAEAEETIDNLLQAVDEEKQKSDSLRQELHEIKSKKIVDDLTTEMTATQKEKLGTMIDNIEFKNESDYKERVSIVVETLFSNEKTDEEINEDKTDEVHSGHDDRMALYVKHLKNSK